MMNRGKMNDPDVSSHQKLSRGAAWTCCLAGLYALVALALLAPRLLAADPAKDAPAAAKGDLPKPDDVTLLTQDKVSIVATYYGSDLEKKAVPVILLHGFKGSRADLKDLAAYLQQEHHHAVVAVDLRGHGKSTKVEGGRDLDAASLKKNDFLNMVYDLEAVKDFLLKENNAGKLNIEKLCVVGSEMGATVAEKWAAYDWHWPQLIGVKQGRDVKALVLLSPEINFNAINIKDDLANTTLQTQLSTMLLVGQQKPKEAGEAKKINQVLERIHPEPAASATPEEKAEKKELYFIPIDTTLQGSKLLGAKLGVEPGIAKFIERRLVNKTFPWTDRNKK